MIAWYKAFKSLILSLFASHNNSNNNSRTFMLLNSNNKIKVGYIYKNSKEEANGKMYVGLGWIPRNK